MKLPFLALFGLLSTPLVSSAISVSFSLQSGIDPFFTPTALATIQKAAADVSSAITTTLAGLNNLHYTGSNGITTTTADWTLSYLDPTNGITTINLSTASQPANDFHIFIASRPLSGTTLGLGSPGGAGAAVNGTGQAAELPGALDNLETNSNLGMTRGGPPLGTISDSLGGVPFDLSFGYALGSLVFDNDSVWNLDYNTLPSAGQNDLYSVAVHEMLHTLGFGGGQTWTSHASGTDWTGTAVISLLGSGANVLSAGADHVNGSLTGHPLVNGVFQTGTSQAPIMSPSLLVGTRGYITDLDLAFLTDMGWQTVSVPEPGSTAFLVIGGLAFLSRRSRRMRIS